MAQIKLNSKIVIEACENSIKNSGMIHQSDVEPILDLAKFSENYGLLEITIDHNDFALIGEYLPKPTTYSSTSKPETKLNPGDRICSDCKKIWPNDDAECPHCGNDVPF